MILLAGCGGEKSATPDAPRPVTCPDGRLVPFERMCEIGDEAAEPEITPPPDAPVMEEVIPVYKADVAVQTEADARQAFESWAAASRNGYTYESAEPQEDGSYEVVYRYYDHGGGRHFVVVRPDGTVQQEFQLA
ncbi:hypothetical protein JXB02_06500 [Candidatus Woesearchaeota archaeon]|nr:hypothetical protein [Candidatus Woesearchaeota archaeon]